MSLEFDVQGLENLRLKLRNLSETSGGKGGRFALRKAANVIRDEVKSGADRLDRSRTREHIAANVSVRFDAKASRRSGDLKFRVGVLGGAASPKTNGRYSRNRSDGYRRDPRGLKGGDTFYWRFVEFGTQNQRAQPFVRPALQSKAQEAINVYIREFDKWIDRAVRRGVR